MTTQPPWRAGTAGSVSGTSFSVSVPSGLVAGDCVTVEVESGNTISTLSPPDASWHQVFADSLGIGGVERALWWHKATSGDTTAGSWTFTQTTSTGGAKYVCGSWPGADVDGTPIVASSHNNQSSGSNTVTLSAITPGVANCTLAGWAFANSSIGAVNVDAAMTQRIQTTIGTWNVGLGDQALTSSGSTGTRTFSNASGATPSRAWAMIAIAPAPPIPVVISPSSVSATATPATPTITATQNRRVAPAAASATATPATPHVGVGQKVTPAATSATLTPGTPTIGHSVTISPAAATLGLTPGTPTIGHSGRAAPTPASLAATPSTPALVVDHIVTPAAKSATATPATAKIGASRTITPAAASLTASPATPSVGVGYFLHPTLATLALTPATPLIGHSGLAVPIAAALGLTGGTPIIGTSKTLAFTAATLAVTLATPSIGTSQHVAPSAAALTLTGAAIVVPIGAFVRPATINVAIALAIPVVIGYMPPVLTVPTYATQLTSALRGAYGPARYSYLFEVRKADYTFVQDITPWVVADSAKLDLNNDRAVTRQLTVTLDMTRRYHGAALDIDPLSDHIVPRMRLALPRRVVGWPASIDVPMGLYQMTWPDKTFQPNSQTWDIQCADLCMQLQQDGPEDVYTVAAGVDCITGTNAVTDILTAQGLRYSLTSAGLTTAAAKTYDPGTPWLTIINDLLGQANYYALYFDRTGIARTRKIDDLNTRPTDATYGSGDAILIPWKEQGDLTRFANRVVVTLSDPSVAPMHATATNSDPDNPVSTVALDRTITKFLQVSGAADQATLNARAFSELQQAAAFYRTADLITIPDPLREPNELYYIDLPDASDGQVWQVRNWQMELRENNATPMKHTLSRVEKLVAA